MQQADSVEEWLRLAESWKRQAEFAVGDPVTRNAAWANTGFVLECVLKAAIMSKERLDRWPDRGQRREVFTHDLERLAGVLGMRISPADDVAASWAVVTLWRRDHMYVARDIPEPVVRSLMEAVFAERGVMRWILRTYLPSHLRPDGSIWLR